MSICRVMISGNVGSDPEIRRAGSSDVLTFSIAVNQKQGQDDFLTWFRVQTFFDKLIDYCEKFVRKGDLVTVSGDLLIREFEGRSGTQTSNDVTIRGFGDIQADPRSFSQGDRGSSRDSRGSGRDNRDSRGSRDSDRGRDRGSDRGGDRGGDRGDSGRYASPRDTGRTEPRSEPRGGTSTRDDLNDEIPF